MLHYYDGQIRRYLIQIMRVLSQITVKKGDGSLDRVPVIYGDIDRQVANIINQNSENAVSAAPKISVYITDLLLDRDRLADATYIGKLHIREREVVDGAYTTNQGQNYTVERLMPTPYRLTVKADIWTTSADQKLQILEQLLVFFNPSLELQTTENFVDWSSITVLDLDNITFSSRTVPVGTNDQIDIASLTLVTPIWISPPVKVKRLGVITNIITNVFADRTENDYGYIDGLGTDSNGYSVPSGDVITINKTTIGNYDIVVDGKEIKAFSNTPGGPWIKWTRIVGEHPGIYRPGLTRICLLQSDNTEVVGYLTINPLDDTILTVGYWDEDTFPTNDSIPGPTRVEASWGSFDAVIDPTKTGPTNVTAGTRYLIIDSIGGGHRDTFTTENSIQLVDTGIDYSKVNSFKIYVDGIEYGAVGVNRNNKFCILTASMIPANSVVEYEVNLNQDGPDAWKNTNNSDFIAEANDIIEWNGTNWVVVFSAKESSDQLIYQTNLYTMTQYKWNGVSWVRSFEGEYKRGQWRLVL